MRARRRRFERSLVEQESWTDRARRDWDRLRAQADTPAERAEIDALFSRVMP